MKLLENHPDEALHVDSAELDKATGIDDEALLNTIENDIHHEVSRYLAQLIYTLLEGIYCFT